MMESEANFDGVMHHEISSIRCLEKSKSNLHFPPVALVLIF